TSPVTVISNSAVELAVGVGWSVAWCRLACLRDAAAALSANVCYRIADATQIVSPSNASPRSRTSTQPLGPHAPPMATRGRGAGRGGAARRRSPSYHVDLPVPRELLREEQGEWGRSTLHLTIVPIAEPRTRRRWAPGRNRAPLALG